MAASDRARGKLYRRPGTATTAGVLHPRRFELVRTKSTQSSPGGDQTTTNPAKLVSILRLSTGLVLNKHLPKNSDIVLLSPESHSPKQTRATLKRSR